MAETTNALSSPIATADRSEPAQAVKEDKLADATMAEEKAQSAPEDAKVNGDSQHSNNDMSDAPAAADQETTMNDAEEPSATAASSSGQAAAPTNGTPASSKKATNGLAKKKSGGVPEHKSKKLNKKRSKAQLTQLDAEPGEYYFARMKGHPPWPAVICDEEMLPQSLLSSRPVTTRQADGSFRKPEYADGGKRAHERTFPVMFLHTNEFAWVPNTELSPLDPEQCKETDPKGKKLDLVAAYAIAAENHDLAFYKGLLSDHQAALEADLDAKAGRDAKKASKSKRKSVDLSALADDADEMDIDEEVAPEKPKSKKRKKEADGDVAEEKPAKTPKTGTKLKLSTPKNPTAEPSKKTPKTKGSTAKKSKKAVADEEEAQVEEEPKLTPAQQKEKSQKLVLYWRHKLQRGFLSRDTVPKKEEMKDMSDFLEGLEDYKELDGAIIRGTKIHKVLKAMLKLDTIPLDEEFEFKDRCRKLLAKWTTILESDPNGNGDKDTKAEPATGTEAAGDAHETEKQAEKAVNGEAPAPEEEKEEAIKNKIGTTTEGEKEEAASTEETAEEKKTDAPAVDSAPAEEYKPPVVETAEETAA